MCALCVNYTAFYWDLFFHRALHINDVTSDTSHGETAVAVDTLKRKEEKCGQVRKVRNASLRQVGKCVALFLSLTVHLSLLSVLDE